MCVKCFAPQDAACVEQMSAYLCCFLMLASCAYGAQNCEVSVGVRHACAMAWVDVGHLPGRRWMSNVSLHTFTLGNIPPRVFGIKVGLSCS